ncbi:MAG: HNH endonuclease [Blastocatellia bacterium]|nr:HNH endonuclease [Blastocatellia bacterium]
MVLTRKVLLLNASYEPLGLIGIPRAIRLVWKGAAEMIELDGDRVLRSPRFVFPAPSVIRLIVYIDVRGRQSRSPSLRAGVFARDRYRCQYCGGKGTAFELTLDHIMPRSRGGRTAAENLCAACKDCNQRKGNRTPEEARMPLLSNPSALSYGLEKTAVYRAAEGSPDSSRPEWRKYLFLEDAETGAA